MMKQFTDDEKALLSRYGEECYYGADEAIFSEGDPVDFIYFIVSGKVSVFIEQFNSREVIQTLGEGQCVGEMALFHSNTRTASAAAIVASHMQRIPTSVFLRVLSENPSLAAKVNEMLSQRSEELVLREKLIDLSGLANSGCHIGIKGDPSLRESALSRERYESVVDHLMDELVPLFEDLLLNRSAYRLYVGCNNGEVRISSIFDPFSDEYHSVSRLIDKGYLERHFPHMDYEEKNAHVLSYYDMMARSKDVSCLPDHLKRGFTRYYETWRPASREALQGVLAKFPLLREIPNFYIRNATFSTIKDVIHLQFNCDGTHILSEKGFHEFLEQNL